MIEVTESAATMDIVFRHLYGAPLPFLPMSKDDDETLVNKASFENFILAVGVLEAADKVGLSRCRAKIFADAWLVLAP